MSSPANRVLYETVSDMDLDGNYRETQLVLEDGQVYGRSDDRIYVRLPLDQIQSVHCTEFVGNGILQARLRDGRQVRLIRYSKTLSETFEEAAKRINLALGLDPVQTEEQRPDTKSGPPREVKLSYRCPNCGLPLKHPGDVCPKCVDVKSTLLRLAKFLKPYRAQCALGLFLAIAFVGMQLSPPVFLRYLIDGPLDRSNSLILHERYVLLGLLVGCLAVVFIARAFTAWGRNYLMGWLGSRLIYDVRNRLYRALQRLSLSFYDHEHTGRIMSRVTSDTMALQQFVVGGMQNLIINVLTLVGIGAIMIATNWKLALLTLLPMPLVILGTTLFARRVRHIYRRLRRKVATLHKVLGDTISGVQVVKAFAQEQREIRNFASKNREHLDARMDVIRLWSRFGPMMGFFTSLGMIVIYFFGGHLIIAGQGLTKGEFVMFGVYMAMFYGPVQMLAELTDVFQQAAVSAERIFGILDQPSEVADAANAKPLGEVKGHVVFDTVHFSYEPTEEVLRHINLDVRPGEMIGLVGPTGAGKSTIVNLLARFYDTTKGRILLDGRDLREVPMRELRQNIGMVLQDTFLFSGSIRENIVYGRPGATDEEVVHAAKAARAHDFIMELPDAYDTHVGERGATLSGGERQRISIARAILKDPPILILDEATSSVDTATEFAIQEAMDRLMKGRTTFAIAHRLSTLRNADRLVVIEDGRISEMGTHFELLSRGGTYATLCQIQADLVKVDG